MAKYQQKIFVSDIYLANIILDLMYMIKVRQFQNEFMKLSFLPKYEWKIVRISALFSKFAV